MWTEQMALTMDIMRVLAYLILGSAVLGYADALADNDGPDIPPNGSCVEPKKGDTPDRRGGGGEAWLSLDNGVITVRIDLCSGGAITYLSVSGEDRNLINNYDRGRQIQQSYYAGKLLDRQSEGQHSAWTPWSWNPVQVGDAHGKSSRVLNARNDGSELYVKTLPLLWDMDDETAQCHLEQWVTLKRNVLHVRNRLTVFRTDDRWGVEPRNQELPAVYTIADLHHLFTYEGTKPFTHGALTEIHNLGPPWTSWGKSLPSEKWAALVDDSMWGIGVYNATTQYFTGGFSGSPGGGTRDPSTGYISPLREETLGKDAVFRYEYDIIVGTLGQIRAFVYSAEGIREHEQCNTGSHDGAIRAGRP